VQLFMQVDDCPAHVARALELGASVLIPPQALPDGDVMAILKDPAGLSFGVFHSTGA
jgi:predicted enzyme related to lactoylglutathione lyase